MTITIVGAGISGLVLGRCLLHRGVRAVLIEKSPIKPSATSSRNNYGITLHRSAYQGLLGILGMDDASFRKKVGMLGDEETGESFWARRRQFEELLAEGLDVRWGQEVESLNSKSSSSGGLELKLKEGEKIKSEVVVGADGPHSIVRRTVAPETEFELLPFAVYNGKRKLARNDFETQFGKISLARMGVHQRRLGEVVVQSCVSDWNEDEVRMSYVYSRPARKGEDKLYRPQRENAAAKQIPEALFEEIDELSRQLAGPPKTVFDPEKMRGDRLLNWLMRVVEVDGAKLHEAAEDGIVLLGDSVHAEPILGGEGANVAIQDGLILAELLLEKDPRRIHRFYEQREDVWARSRNESKTRISSMHGIETASWQDVKL